MVRLSEEWWKITEEPVRDAKNCIDLLDKRIEDLELLRKALGNIISLADRLRGERNGSQR